MHTKTGSRDGARGGPGAGTAAIEVVVVGASAGGPPALEKILIDLGAPLAVPIVIAQHMPATFTRSFAGRLDRSLPMRVREAAHLEALRPGVVYIAPGDSDLGIERRGGELRAVRRHPPAGSAGSLHGPSIDHLFASAGAATRGRLVAVLLTGMGNDGAAAMVHLALAGAHTIAQDHSTCAIFGMPRAAIEAGGAREVLPLPAIAARLHDLSA
jgi:two-component system chemotaxis response regulator CheB